MGSTTVRLVSIAYARGYAVSVAQKQLWRIKGRAELGGCLGRHVEGRSRPAEAKPRDALPATIAVGGDMSAARRALAAARRASNPRGGRRALPAREMLFGGPQFSEDPNTDPAAELARLCEWADACVAWVDARRGRAVVASATLHLDESQPHVHLVLVPVARDGKLRFTGAAGVERQFLTPDQLLEAHRLDERVARKEISSRKAAAVVMSMLQDAYHSGVGERFGLERGERGSGTRHQPINRRVGFVRRVLTDPLTSWTAQQKLEAGREAIQMVTGALEQADRAHRGRRRADQRAAEAETAADQRAAEAETAADQRAAEAETAADQRAAEAETAADQRATAAVAAANRREEEADERVAKADERVAAEKRLRLEYEQEGRQARVELAEVRKAVRPLESATKNLKEEVLRQFSILERLKPQVEQLAEIDRLNANLDEVRRERDAASEQHAAAVAGHAEARRGARDAGLAEGRTQERSALAGERQQLEQAQEGVRVARESHAQAVEAAREDGRVQGRSERAGAVEELTGGLETARADVERLEREARESRVEVDHVRDEAAGAEERTGAVVDDLHAVVIDLEALQRRHMALQQIHEDVRQDRDELRVQLRTGAAPERPSITTPGGGPGGRERGPTSTVPEGAGVRT